MNLTLTNATPYLAVMGKLWGVFRALKTNFRDISSAQWVHCIETERELVWKREWISFYAEIIMAYQLCACAIS